MASAGRSQRGWDHVFEAEDASKEEAEDGGAESTAGNDGRQVQLLKPVKKETADKEQKPLSHVSEHEAEKEGIGDGDQKCRIKFIVGREAIHLHKHLKGRRSAGFFSRVGGVLVTCSRLSSMTKKVEASSSSSF